MIDDVHLSNPNRSAESAPRASAGGGGCVFGASKVVSLGNITKSYSADVNDSKNSKVLRFRRFALKAVSSNILPDTRTSKCMRWRAPNSQVEVWRGVSAGVAGKAFYKGLFVCGSLWLCPVCAAKISERRRVELSTALNSARAQGLKVMLLTQTIRHGLGDSLSGAFKGIAAAEKRMWGDRSATAFRDEFGLVGTIKTTEVTWGASNGWHPHKHTLLILSGDVSPEYVQKVLSPLWVKSCVSAGLPAPSLDIGLTVQDGSYADDYVCKWGLESEMTKGHSKVAKVDGFTPFALLQNILDTGDAQSWELFKEYAAATKGKRQLVWSKGLRARLMPDVAETSDQELAESVNEDVTAIFWATLSVQEWRAVKFFEYEATLLDKSESSQSSELFQQWLNSVTDAYRYAKNIT